MHLDRQARRAASTRVAGAKPASGLDEGEGGAREVNNGGDDDEDEAAEAQDKEDGDDILSCSAKSCCSYKFMSHVQAAASRTRLQGDSRGTAPAVPRSGSRGRAQAPPRARDEEAQTLPREDPEVPEGPAPERPPRRSEPCPGNARGGAASSPSPLR